MVPPPRQMGERLVPARARPVPFCLQGFLPPPRDLAAALGLRGPGPAFGQLIDYDLMEHMSFHGHAENGFTQFELARHFAGSN